MKAVAAHWRAFVGRLPKAVEADLQRLADLRGPIALAQAVDKVCSARLRRTRARVAMLYRVLDVEPPRLAQPREEAA